MADSINKVGDERDNVITGGHGDNVLSGYGGHDTIHGGNRHDILNGGEGDDDLYGSAGTDTLNSGSGQDTLTGGSGADIFELVLDGGADQITDFSVSQGDKIRIDTDAGTEDSLQDLGFSITGNSNAANIVYQSETILTLTGVSASDMLSASFDTYFDVV